MSRHTSRTNSSVGSFPLHGHRKSRSRSLKPTSSSDMTHHSSHHHEDQDPDRFFVVPRGVILEYGPYPFHGVNDFRQERLQGMQKQLEALGARVKMIPCTDFANRVQIWYMDEVIFVCKITDLHHGGDGEIDRLCIDAARSFDRASRKAIQGLRHRIAVETKELVEPFCPCLNPGPTEDIAEKEKEADAVSDPDEAAIKLPVKEKKGRKSYQK